MPFQYTPDMPVASHLPSADQPLMNANSQYLNDFDSRDHQFTKDSTNANDGTHKQVTLTNKAAPGFAGASSVVYANTANAQSQLFFQNAIGSVQLTTQIASVPMINSPGVTYLPGGLLIQWGISVSSGAGEINFPVAYSVATFSPVVAFAPVSGPTVTLLVSTASTKFTITPAGVGVSWIAIGQAL